MCRLSGVQALGTEIANHEYDHLAFFQNTLQGLGSPYPPQTAVRMAETEYWQGLCQDLGPGCVLPTGFRPGRWCSWAFTPLMAALGSTLNSCPETSSVLDIVFRTPQPR